MRACAVDARLRAGGEAYYAPVRSVITGGAGFVSSNLVAVQSDVRVSIELPQRRTAPASTRAALATGL